MTVRGVASDCKGEGLVTVRGGASDCKGRG